MTRPSAEFQPRKRPVQHRSAETVEVILEATVRILEGGDPAAFTTKAVAATAGVSVGSLYQYFPNKKALVSELLQRKLGDLVAVTRAACGTAPPGVTPAIAHVIEQILLEKRRDQRWWRALKLVTQTVSVNEHVQSRADLLLVEIGLLLEQRLHRPLSAGEKARLIIAMDAVEGALSRLVKGQPERLQDDELGPVFTRLFVATLDLPEG
jgi:AcrR family transcriptional regulator